MNACAESRTIERTKTERQSRKDKAWAVVGLLATSGLLVGLHLAVTFPRSHGAVLYAVPVLLAAWLLPTPWTVLVTVEAVGLHAADAWSDRVPALTWSTESATILLIAGLATWAASKTRREALLARENARLAEVRRLEAEQMRDLAAARAGLVEQLAESKKERERFVDMVAHEIAGALTIVFGHAQMIARPLPDRDASTERSAEAILAQTERLDRLITDLRDATRVEHGEFRVLPEPCDLLALVRGCVYEQQATAEGHFIQLRTDMNSLLGEWDCDRMGQVMTNMIRNAVAYSPKGSTVTVHVDTAHDDIRVSVTDQGIGIAAQDLDRLFKAYVRVERTSFSGIKGTGLGLYISKAIIEAHGGTIEVESEPGRGTTFTVVLPLTPEVIVSQQCDPAPVPLAQRAWPREARYGTR